MIYFRFNKVIPSEELSQEMCERDYWSLLGLKDRVMDELLYTLRSQFRTRFSFNIFLLFNPELRLPFDKLWEADQQYSENYSTFKEGGRQ